MLLTPSGDVRTLTRTAAAAAVAALVTGALPFLAATPASAAGSPRAPKVAVTAGDTKVYAVAGRPDTLPDDVRTSVLATLATYLRTTATRTRTPAAADAALAPVLTPTAATRLAGPDRATLLDEGLPAPTGKVKVAATPVTLTALADDGGTVVLVTAGIDATTTVPTKSGKVTVHRTGALVLVPVDGAWKIQGYQLEVERTGRKLGTVAGTPVTTVAPAPASTAPAAGT